jgi:hypothetical protein
MWDLSGTNSSELSKLVGTTGGPPGSRSRHLGIKRGMRMVGFVRWCRNHPRIKENLSGGVGLVCGMKCGISERVAQLRQAFAHVRSRNEFLKRSQKLLWRSLHCDEQVSGTIQL